MDRRQVLVGMTAIGVAGSLNLSDTLRAQSIESATNNPPARYAHMSDGERRELLGPVKMCIEEGPSLVTTKESTLHRRAHTRRSATPKAVY